MKLIKYPNWQARLCQYIHLVAARPVRPCLHDCAKFGAGAIQAQTGVDLSERWGSYQTLDQGLEMLKEHGYVDHIALVADLLPEVAPLSGRVGDIAVLDGEIDQSIGVVQGASIYVVGLRGLTLVSLTQAKRVFRV